MAVGLVLAQILHEFLGHHQGQFVGLLVIVAEGQCGCALLLEAYGDTTLVADDAHLAILHGSQRVGHDRESGDTGGTGADDVAIDEGHLIGFIVILVVHIVDNLQRIHVGLGQPSHHILKLVHQLVILQIVASDGGEVGTNLFARNLIPTAIDGIEQTLGQIGTSSEELHLLTDFHRTHTAGDAIIVTIVGSHQVIVLILDGRGLDRHLGAVVLPVFGQAFGPEHGEVGFGSRSQVIEGMEDAEGGLGHECASVDTHTTD